MKISFKLSAKRTSQGEQEIQLSAKKRVGGSVTTMRAKSGILCLPELFSETSGIEIPARRVIAYDKKRTHLERKKKLDELLAEIERREMDYRGAFDCRWLQETVTDILHPRQKGQRQTFYEMADEYIRRGDFSVHLKTQLRTIVRCVARFEGYRREVEDRRFAFDVDTVDRNTIDDLAHYIRGEKQLSEKYPKLFQRLLADYPASVTKGRTTLRDRGRNHVVKTMKRVKTMWKWFLDTEKTTNDPFKGWHNEAEKYGTPYYITIEERDTLAEATMPSKHLETQRDIFVFQCLIGCRVSDLTKLTEGNIHDGILEYTPRKTKDEGETAATARIPLHKKAVALIRKYRGMDKKGRLFPFVSDQKYNDAIKQAFTVAGLTRQVEVRNSLTGEIELRPINEVASSHMARRTFIGNAYQKVSDPNIIGKMSGHVEGSRAFARYRKIEDETLRKIIDQL